MRKFSRKRARRFCRLLNWMGRFDPEPLIWCPQPSLRLPPSDYHGYPKLRDEMIRLCKQETP